MDFDSPLPPAEFFLREVIETARLVETDDTAAHRGDNRGLASRDPAFCVGGRQIGARLQHDSPRSINDVLRSLGPGRVTLSLWTHLEIPTKLLIEIEVMEASPRCSSEHFPAVTESIAGRRDRLKKIREFYGAAGRLRKMPPASENRHSGRSPRVRPLAGLRTGSAESRSPGAIEIAEFLLARE